MTDSLVMLEGHLKSKVAIRPSAVKALIENVRKEFPNGDYKQEQVDVVYTVVYVDDQTEDSGFLVKGTMVQVARALGLTITTDYLYEKGV